jgi:hypothetical protein
MDATQVFTKQNKSMKKITYLGFALGAALCINSAALADEIQFTTLPQPVQTTVIRETHIANPSYVTRVVRDEGGVYAVTVRDNGADQVVYVNSEGALVQPSSATTTTTTTTVRQPAQTTEPAEGTVVTYDQVQQDLPRYQLLEKKGRKEVYFDRQTGQKVKVEREKE